VSHYFKRLTMIDFSLGDVDYHLARFSDIWRDLATYVSARQLPELAPAPHPAILQTQSVFQSRASTGSIAPNA